MYRDPVNKAKVTVTVNGTERSAEVDVRWTLADFLRETLGLTGTHLGCEHGICGACTVLLNGHSVRSCLTLAVQVDGQSITTIEGIAKGDVLHPVQQAFHEQHGLQCGFCTPGFILATCELLEGNPQPTEQEIREHLSGNVCRCTGYHQILQAVKVAAQRLEHNRPVENERSRQNAFS